MIPGNYEEKKRIIIKKVLSAKNFWISLHFLQLLLQYKIAFLWEGVTNIRGLGSQVCWIN